MAIEYIHALLLGTSFLASVFLAILVISRKHKSIASIYYFFFMCAVSVHVAGDFFFQLSTNVRDALFWIYIYWIGFFFMGIFFFYFATDFPKKRQIFFTSEQSKMILMLLPLGLIYLLIYTNDFVKQIVFSQTSINYVVYGNVYFMAIIYLALFLGLGLFKLFIDYRQTVFELEKKNIQLVFIGLFIASFFGMLGDTFLIKLLGFGELKLASIFIFISCVIMSYVTIKHKIFTVIPVSEDVSEEKPIIEVQPGKSYFIDEKSKGRKKAFRIFSDIVRHGHQGLAISADHPNQIRQKYLLEKTPILWLSDSAEMKKSNIRPNEIEALNSTIYLFIESAINPVILIDGIKKLLIANGSRKTTEFFKSIMDKANETKSIIFFSVADDENEFISIFNETIAINKTITELEKKLLSRKITQQTHSEMLVETWEELVEKEAEMKMIEEEIIGKIFGVSNVERQLIIEKKALTIIEYYIAKRKFESNIGKEIFNNLNKKIVRLENDIRKKANRY